MPLIPNTVNIGPVKDNVQKTCEEVILAAEAANPGHYVNQVYGFDPSSTPEHSAGTALDLMVYSDRQLGDWIATYLWENRSRLGLRWEIWRQAIRSTSPGKTDNWVGMENRGSTTQNHYDHIHCNFWEKTYVAPDGSSSSVNSPVNPALTDWDGSYPGQQAFAIGSNHPAVTKLGQMLIDAGYGRFYKVGAGVPMGPADVAATKQFQLDQGWTGADADGYAGPETWRRLSNRPAPQQPQQAPARVVSVDHLRVALLIDGPAEQGHETGFANEVQIVEQALADEGLLSGVRVDGSAGTSTFGSQRSAYGQWQLRCGYRGRDADGIPGKSSLTRLGNDHGFSVTD